MAKRSVVRIFLGLLLIASMALPVDSEDICDKCSCSAASTIINCTSRGLRNLPFISNATGVQILDLSENNITNVSSSSLDGVAGSLQVINLGNNQIVGIGDGAFASMPMLQTIILSQNRLSNIPDNAFLGLTLSTLNLSYNNFGTVPSASLRNLKQVNSLYLNHNPLQLLPDTAFDNVTQVIGGIEELDLSYCNLNNETLQPKALNRNNFGFLRNLILDGNNFPHLKAAFFQHFVPSLTILSLKNCSIQKVEQETFGIFNHLQELDLDYNPIEVLEMNLFNGIVLTTLSLQNCRISTIRRGAFKQSHIKTLSLQNCRISTIHSHAFKKSHIKTLKLNNNNLVDTSIGNVIADIHRLVYLDISFNRLTRLPNLYALKSKLRQLRAHDNQILQLSESDLSGMSRLSVLDLSNNNITRVSNNALSDCINLYQLNLSNNSLIQLPNLQNQSNLYQLSVSHCQIEAVPSDLCQTCPRLGKLSVEYNQLTSIPNLSDCRELIEVLLQNNSLQTLNVSTFQGLSLMHTIDLSHNAISSLTQGMFEGLVSLKYLHLGYNNIIELPLCIFEDLVNLSRVDLSNNKIKLLPDNLFQKTGIISDICLNNNDIQDISPIAFAKNLTYLQRLNLSSNAFSKWTLPQGGFPGLVSLSLADVDQLYQAPDPTQCACPSIQLLEFTYPYQCCLWQDLFHTKPTATYTHNNFTPMLPDVASLPGGAPTYVICNPRAEPLSVCNNLMDPIPLRVSMWFILILDLLGNGSVLFVMLASKEKIKVPQFFISNLAFADFCIGVYLAFLAGVDAKTYGMIYEIKQWQNGSACSAAGFFAVFSCELSCCMLVCVTLERVFTIYRSPKHGIGMSTAIIIALVCWLVSFAFAILPLKLVGVNSYNEVAVCLPFGTSNLKDKLYIGVLLMVGVITFLVILVSYLAILCTVCRSPAIGQRRKETIRLLRKVAPLIISYFLCWCPIVIVGCSSLSGKALLDVDKAKWLVVFVYPFNACTNPFCYAIFTDYFRHRIRSILKRTTHTPSAYVRSRNSHKLTEEERHIRRQSYRSHSVTVPIAGALHGHDSAHEALAQAYMRRSSLPTVLRQSEPTHTNHPIRTPSYQMSHTLQNNSLSNVLQSTESQVAVTTLIKCLDSGQLHHSSSVLKETPEDLTGADSKCTVMNECPLQDGHTVVAPCCPPQVTCYCSSRSHVANETCHGRDYMLKPDSRLVGTETEV